MNKQRIGIIILSVALVFGLIGIFVNFQAAAQEISSETNNEKKIIILYKNSVTNENLADLYKKNAKIKTKYELIPAVAVTVNENQLGKIKSNKNVLDVFEDTPVHTTLSSSVPQINADQVHSDGVSGSGVKTCILDTGIDDSHSALNSLIAEYDFVNNDSDATDDNEHGTHVAGIVASTHSTNRGVAPGSSLMAGKVLNQFGSGFSSDVISGVEWCVNNGADIISMSLSGNNFSTACDSLPLAMASNEAVAKGVVVVASSGNDNQPNKVGEPACASNVIAVGAVNLNDNSQNWSNRGSLLDVVAHGVGITSTGLGSSFVSKKGT